jgi:hypothetical protein
MVVSDNLSLWFIFVAEGALLKVFVSDCILA